MLLLQTRLQFIVMQLPRAYWVYNYLVIGFTTLKERTKKQDPFFHVNSSIPKKKYRIAPLFSKIDYLNHVFKGGTFSEDFTILII